MKVLRIRQVCEKVGLGRTSVYERESAGLFPKRIQLGENAVGWLEHEVDQWIEERVRSSRGDDRAEPVAPQG